MLRALLVWALLSAACTNNTAAATVTIACGAVGIELEVCREGAEAWARQSGHRVTVISSPASSSDRLALYQQLLAAGSADIDVFQIDLIWPGILAEHLIDLRRHVAPERLTAQFEAVVSTDKVAGRLVALPWFVDAGLLYYRRDLLDRYGRRVPVTWEELTDTAAAIQAAERERGTRNLWGFVWQGRAYEGLTCDALEWVASHGGGRLIDTRGRPTIDNPRAIAALEQAADWVDRITPPGVLNYAEEQARGVFQSGHAVFMRNWPYAWPLLNGTDSPVAGKVGVTQLPRGEDGQHTATLGGWALAVSRYSKAPAAAIDLVRYLTAAGEQKRRALAAGYHPTFEALYRDPEIIAALPLAQTLRQVLDTAVTRPAAETGRRYNQVSHAFWTAVHNTLSGRGDAATNLRQLERRLERWSHGGWR